MTFEKILREYRKQLGLSQEKLAKKINVSRQAVTKWESGSGMPDITNLKAISELFQVSIDDLLLKEEVRVSPKDYLFESQTSYDIEGEKHFDFLLGYVKSVVLRSVEGEKLQIRLASNTIKDLAEVAKIKIGELKGKIDIKLKRLGSLTESQIKEELTVFIDLPQKYMGDIEFFVKCQELDLIDICSENIELDGEVSKVIINRCEAEIELNSKLDMIVTVVSFKGNIAINQVGTVSKIYIPVDYPFIAVKKGIATKLFFEEDGNKKENFSSQDSENHIEINGIGNELTIIKNSNVKHYSTVD